MNAFACPDIQTRFGACLAQAARSRRPFVRRARPVLCVLGVVAALCAWLAVVPPSTRAQAEPEEYRALITDAVADYAAGRYPEARALFEKANRLHPNARALRGIGMTEFELRDYIDAVVHLEQALSSKVTPLDRSLHAETQKLLAKARRYVSAVRLKLDPPDSRVVIDNGAVQFRPDRELLLQAGDHTLEVRAPGRLSQRRTLRIAGGEEMVVDVALVAEAGAAQQTRTNVTPAREAGVAPAPAAATQTYRPMENEALLEVAPAEHRMRFYFGMRGAVGGDHGVGAQVGLDGVFRFFRLGVELRMLRQFGEVEEDSWEYYRRFYDLDLAFKPGVQFSLGAGRWELYAAAPVGPTLELFEDVDGGDVYTSKQFGVHFSIIAGLTWFLASRVGLNAEIGWQGRWGDTPDTYQAVLPAINLVVPFRRPRNHL